MKAFFAELFQYSHYYNQQLIVLITQNQQQVSEKAVSLLNHILNAQQIWNSRIRELKPQSAVWEIHPIDELPEMDLNNFKDTSNILDNTDLTKQLQYKISTGDSFDSKITDILFHVVNHSTYHRAQIATELKQCGIAPINSDFIVFKRLFPDSL